MVAAALSGWWIFGWVVALVVVLIAALLLITIVALGRRITHQAEEITAALDGARANTDALWAVKSVNINLDRTVRGLKVARNLVIGK